MGVWEHDQLSTDVGDFISLFSLHLMYSFRSYIKHLKEYPNNLKLVLKKMAVPFFSSHFSVFGNTDKTLYLVFDMQPCASMVIIQCIAMKILTTLYSNT